ncbi:MAG: family 78 glycoside hydrolase catalytic domain, partial [Fibrella sp.]|nr:family 78 glycoside hydrolase catalytic domain [Armatimonadota bacterium]
MNSTSFSLSDLRSNARANPLGTGDASPMFSWKLTATDPGYRGLLQSSYRVRVASRAELLAQSPDLWDSGDVASDQSVGVAYAGTALASGERAFWNVSVTNENGEAATSDTAFWEAGLLQRSDWEPAKWISSDLVGASRSTVPLPYLRRTFSVEAVPDDARLHITALGLYRVFLNGVRVGDDELTPGWTDYKKRVQYQTYDVSALLQPGDNVIAVVLGDGWYSGHVEWRGRERYGDRPKLLATLVSGGKNPSPIVATDGNWHVAYGPLLEGDLLMGETFDARREWQGWNTTGFTEGPEWRPALLAEVPDTMEISPMIGPTVKATQELVPIDEPQVIKHWPQNDYVFDFGQNLVGRVRLRVKADAGTTVRLRYAETLKGGPASKTGEIYRDNLRSAQQIDYYTCKGDPDGETWEPMFTFHGFRYVEVNGIPQPPAKDDLTAIVLHSDTPLTGDFECSEPLLNQLQKNIDWGQRGNFVDVPTDCPQRDERLGWTGDAQVFIRTAAWNRDVQGFFYKWFRDMRDAQGPEGQIPSVIPDTGVVPGDGGPAWADAGVICPWTMYLTYGDKSVLETQYESMTRFVDYLETIAIDGLRSHPDYKGFHGFGDWLAQ